MITKGPEDANRLRRPVVGFVNGRSALKAFLMATGCRPREAVALPSYIGWSPREGSGVLDPIVDLGLVPLYYRVDAKLQIDMDSFASVVSSPPRPVVVLIIHYFGHRDAAYPEAVELAHDHSVLVVEDEAHAMLTDLVGGITGRLGDASIFSLHKLLPVAEGGALVLNRPNDDLVTRATQVNAYGALASPLLEFDLFGIADARVSNARLWTELLAPLSGRVDPLWGSPAEGEVPQSYPVRVRSGSRDRLYDLLNERGVGAVSLYHTLVSPLAEVFPECADLSRTILNLPVHQDMTADELAVAVEVLADAVGPA